MGDSVRQSIKDQEAADYLKQIEKDHGGIIFYLFTIIFIMGISGFIGWTWGQDSMRVSAAKLGAARYVFTGKTGQTKFQWRVCEDPCSKCELINEEGAE